MAVERFITESGSLSLEQMESQTSPVRVYFVVALDESPQISCEVQFAEESGLGNPESLVCPYVSSIEGEHFYSCTYKPLLYLYLTGDENNQDSDLCIQNNTTVTFVDNKFILNGETVHGRFALNFGEYNLVVHSQHPLRLIDNDTSKIRITGQFTHTNGSSKVGYHGNVVISVYEDFGTISYECTKHGAMGGTNNLIFNTQCRIGEPIIPTPTPSPSATPSPSVTPSPSPTESPTYVETYIDGPSPTPSPTESPTYVETYIDGPSGPQGELLFNVESVELRDVYSSSQSLYEGLNTDPLPGDYFSALVLNNFTINEDSSFYDSSFPQSGYGGGYEYASSGPIGGGYEYASSGPIGGGYASLSYGFIIHKKDVTLTDEEIAVAHEDLYNGIDSLNYIMGTPTIGDLNENIVLETLSDNNESTDYIKSVNGSNYAGIVYPRTTAYLSGESPSDLKQDIGQVDALVFNNLVDGDDLGATIFIVSESTNEDSSILYRQAFPINKISGSITSSINELAIDIDLESDSPTNESSVTVQSITGEESGVYTLYYDEVNDPSVSVTYLVSLRTSDTDDDYENGGLEITLTSEVVRPRIELHQSDTLYVGYLTKESGTGINYLDLQMTTHGPSGPQGDTETPTPSPSATETPTPIPFNMETVDFTDPDLIFYVSVSNIQGAYSYNGKTTVGNFKLNDNASSSSQSQKSGIILGDSTYSHWPHNYIIQVDLIHPTTSVIKTWASSYDSTVTEVPQTLLGLSQSYNTPGFIFFGTTTNANQFDGYILHDIKIEESHKTSSSYSGAEFTLDLYSHSSSSNQYNGVKLGSLLYTTSTCGTSTSPDDGYWWSVTSRSWDAN